MTLKGAQPPDEIWSPNPTITFSKQEWSSHNEVGWAMKCIKKIKDKSLNGFRKKIFFEVSEAPHPHQKKKLHLAPAMRRSIGKHGYQRWPAKISCPAGMN